MKGFLKPLAPFLRPLAGLPAGLRIQMSPRPLRDAPRLYYGFPALPRSGDVSSGGITKFQILETRFPNTPRGFNLLYLLSSAMPYSAGPVAWFARRRGIRFLWNQNGVAYPAWHPHPGWKELNRRMASLLHQADYAVYQSEFCKKSADHFLGPRRGPSEILYNSVDVQRFSPAAEDPSPGRPVLLLGGTQMQAYRVASALKTLSLLRNSYEATLLISGELTWTDPDKAMKETLQQIHDLNLAKYVTLIGPYTQEQAPSLYRRAHILLHTKYNDPCPTVVLEAMASGLPVVYSASGGVPELVGGDGGVGVAAPVSWEKDFPPEPEKLAQAVATVWANRDLYARQARRRAEQMFSSDQWILKHEAIFKRLLNS